MSILLSGEEVRNQSLNVWAQFGEKLWKPNAEINAKLPRKDINKLEHSGVGKFMVLAGMGPSLESEIENLKKYRDRFDLVCCDKAFGPLLDHGIKADYVVVADAGIPFKYIEKHIDQTEGVKLLATPYANPEWTTAWKGDRYFYVNQDSIESEKIFTKIMGEPTRIIPASSNVSNAMVVFWTECDEKRNENWGGYERYFLIGYDYSWPCDGNYYAWNNVKPKRYYNCHRTLLDYKGNIVFTSENLMFSAKWLVSFVSSFNLPVINCSDQGLLEIQDRSTLGKELGNITTDKRKIDFTKRSFEIWKSSIKNLKMCEENFNRSREELLWL